MRLVLFVVVPLVLLVAVGAALQLRAADQHLRAGARTLSGTELSLRQLAAINGSGERRLQARFAAAHGQFADARADLRLWAPILSAMEWLPGAGPQLSSARPAADAGYYATGAALDLVGGLERLPPAGSAGTFRRLAGPLHASQPRFRAAATETERAELAVSHLPVRSGNRALDRGVAELRRDLPRLYTAACWLVAAPDLLGAVGPSHELIVFQNPAELRATGGFIGAAGYLTAHGGVVHSEVTDSALPHEIGTVPPPLPEALYTAEGPWIFRDANWSPDFPLSARLERWFYGEDTGRWADGVISIQDTGMREILAGTGAVYLPAYGTWVSAGNLDVLARRYVNGSYHGPLQGGSPGTRRKQFFAWITASLVRRVASLPLNRWPALGAALAHSIQRRDLMLYDRRPAVAAAIRAARAGGHLAAPAGDVLAIVDDNRSYNKLNPYVDEGASYAAVIRPDLSIDARLTIRYHVNPSPPDLEGAGPGFGYWGSKHDYQDFVRIYVPRGARLREMRGLQGWAPAPAYGLTQFAGRMLLRAGASRTVTLRWTLPAASVVGRDDWYRLTVRHQPGSTLRRIALSIRGAAGVSFHAGGTWVGQIAHTVPLDTDAHVVYQIRGTHAVKPQALPTLPAHPDPYIPWADLRDPHHPL